MHQCLKFVLFRNDTLHVSDGLSVHHHEFTIYLQQQACVKQILLLLANEYEMEHLVPASKQ